jgi:hypothetical protein
LNLDQAPQAAICAQRHNGEKALQWIQVDRADFSNLAFFHALAAKDLPPLASSVVALSS